MITNSRLAEQITAFKGAVLLDGQRGDLSIIYMYISCLIASVYKLHVTLSLFCNMLYVQHNREPLNDAQQSHTAP